MAEQIKVGVDTGDSLQQLEDMAKAVNSFTQEVGKVSGKPVRLLDVTNDIAELKELLQNWREVINAAPTLRGAINSANTNAGRPAGDRPATPMQLDQSLRQNQQWMHATMVRLMTHNASRSNTPASTGLSYHDYTGRFQDAPGAPPSPVNRPAQNDSRFSKVASSAVQGLGAGGVAGGAVASFARGAEQANDAGMGVMGILKGGGVAALAYGAYKAVSAGVGAVSDKMDAGKQENIEVDKFRRALGATNESFEQLRNQSRAVGEQFNLAYEQSRKLTVEFANIAKVNSPTLAAMGIGLAQATGADESQGVGFMATMRRSGSLGEKTADARLLSIQFAEALKRTGSTLNAGDLMGAMGSFAATTAQRSLGAANVEGFAGLLSAMVGSGTPGLHGNVGNAANILNRADSAFQGGGGMGEASNTLQFMAMGGDKVGLLGIKMRQAAGMMASGDNVFGNKESQTNQFLRQGGGADMTRFGGKKSGLEQVLDMFDRSGVDKQTQLLSASNHFKMNPEEMATLFNLREQGQLNGLTQMFGQYKGTVDPTKLSSHGLMAMADIQQAGMNPADLAAVRDKMAARGGLTDEQTIGLSKARGISDPKLLQEALVKVATTFEREKNLGEQAQVTAAKIEHSTARMADMLIPAATATKDLLSNLLSWMAPDSEQGKARKNAERWDAYGANPDAMAERNAHYDRKRKLGGHNPTERAKIDAEQRADMGSYAGQSIRRGPADAQRSSGMGGPEDAIKYFMGKGWSREQAQGIAANFQAESNFDPSAKGDYVGGKPTATGAMQWHKDRAEKFQQRSGQPLAGSSLHDQYDFFDHELRVGQERVKGRRLLNARTASEASSIVVDAVRPFDPDGKKRRNRSATAESYSNIQIPATPAPKETALVVKPAQTPSTTAPAQLPAGHAGDRPSQVQTSQAGGVATANIIVDVRSADGLKASAQQYPTSMVFKPKATGAWQSLVQ